MLKYAHENGCPWDERTCESAADYGHLDVLKYARENGCPIPQSMQDFEENDDYGDEYSDDVLEQFIIEQNIINEHSDHNS